MNICKTVGVYTDSVMTLFQEEKMKKIVGIIIVGIIIFSLAGNRGSRSKQESASSREPEAAVASEQDLQTEEPQKDVKESQPETEEAAEQEQSPEEEGAEAGEQSMEEEEAEPQEESTEEEGNEVQEQSPEEEETEAQV